MQMEFNFSLRDSEQHHTRPKGVVFEVEAVGEAPDQGRVISEALICYPPPN